MAGYAKPTPLPARFAHLGLASLYPVTPAETISSGDASALETLLYRYAFGTDLSTNLRAAEGIGSGHGDTLLASLTETYGASGHEEKVREEVKRRLPKLGQAGHGRRGKSDFEFGRRKDQFESSQNSFCGAHG